MSLRHACSLANLLVSSGFIDKLWLLVSSELWLQHFGSSIHPFLYPLNPLQGQLSLGERRGTPWTGVSFGCTKAKETHNHANSNLPPVNLTCMFLDGGRKPVYPEKTHAYTRRTYKLHTERPQVGSNLEPFCC